LVFLHILGAKLPHLNDIFVQNRRNIPAKKAQNKKILLTLHLDKQEKTK